MRLIDAEALKSYMDECSKESRFRVYYGYAESFINDAPTIDAVPVVRCFECEKHYEFNGEHYCKFWRMYCPDDSDFFCKAGERKEGADNEP